MIRILRGHSQYVNAVDISPDGKLVASGSGWMRPSDGKVFGEVLIWDGATGQKIRRLSERCGYGNGLAFNPDGKLLAAVEDGGPVRLYDTATWMHVRTFLHPAP